MNQYFTTDDPNKIGMDIILNKNSGYQFVDREHNIAGLVHNKADYDVEISVRIKRHYTQGNIAKDWAAYMAMKPCKHGHFNKCLECQEEYEAEDEHRYGRCHTD